MSEHLETTVQNFLHTHQITVKPRPSSSSSSSKQAARECRICLESQLDSDDPLAAPCACTGSVRYIHVRCFRMWIEKQYRDREVRGEVLAKGVRCELCHAKYSYSFRRDYRCNSWEEFRQVLHQKGCLFAILVSYLLFCLGLLCFAVVFAQSDRRREEFDISQPRFLLMYVALSLSILCLGYGVYQFFAIYVVGESVAFHPETYRGGGRLQVIHPSQPNQQDSNMRVNRAEDNSSDI